MRQLQFLALDLQRGSRWQPVDARGAHSTRNGRTQVTVNESDPDTGMGMIRTLVAQFGRSDRGNVGWRERLTCARSNSIIEAPPTAHVLGDPMKRILLAATVASILAVTLVGCSVPAAPETEPEKPGLQTPSPTSAPTPTPTPTLLTWTEFPAPAGVAPQTNARGDIIKSVGEVGGFLDLAGETVLFRFMVHAITPDPACTAPEAAQPANGRYIRVDLQAESDPALAAAYEQGGVPSAVFLQTWEAVDANGVAANAPTVTKESFTCLTAAEQIQSEVGPGERAIGSIVLDVPTSVTHVTLVSNTAEETGWEFTLPK
ncbi:hypothetical protein [Microbacterium trichothecenolyticum]|uniref:Uncharacterized protein n=1 Tax=Microbacterium trichothecenolyticum TaxID=69370 RepID=A0A0M2HMN8_MICTR|nr:hypothetical protein [Microbacterium trichothecenolyticum]KJL45704.1 hypothetical protein RS82_00066 [Microbacterium trichothecenolyticum]